jgi:hypothetical protein
MMIFIKSTLFDEEPFFWRVSPMFFRNIVGHSQRQGLIVFSLFLALLFTFSAVQLMAADAGKTAVNNAAPQQAGAVFTGTVLTDGQTVLTTTTTLSATGAVTTYTIYMPVMYNPMFITATRPNSANQWTINWENIPSATGYTIQESSSSDFSTVTELSLGTVNSYQYNNPLSFNNVYYYRLKPVYATYEGAWSNTEIVVGGYRDDFSDASSGWVPMRRTTYLEETNAYYGSGSEAGNLIIIVADKWDWLIASPLTPAPEVPYAIQYRARVHDASNLVSGGMVFGGDWNGLACPEYGNIYQTTNCFNQFYNFNFIYYGPLKLLYEQVDSLFYCPTCGESQIKRVGPTSEYDPAVPLETAKDWHTYRVEVRSTGAILFIDGVQKTTYSDTSYIYDPYFGVFASTFEYKPSIWFFDYFQIEPLD